jgi:hypothetical protein
MEQIAKMLLNNGSDLSLKDQSGNAPLNVAKNTDLPAIAALLQEKMQGEPRSVIHWFPAAFLAVNLKLRGDFS